MTVRASVRVFISYAHDDPAHEARVRDFWRFLRANGIDARIDLVAAEQRVDWTEWMTQEVRDADFVLVVASPAYKRRAEGDAESDEGRGVQWEARQIRDQFYADQKAGLQRFVPVVLPEGSAEDLPLWLAPHSAMYYTVTSFTVPGAERLLRVLTSQPSILEPGLGPVPVLPPEAMGPAGTPPPRPDLHTEIVIEAALSAEGELDAAVWVAGTRVSHRQVPLPAEVATVWSALTLPALVAAERMSKAGHALAAALLSEADQTLIAGLLDQLSAEDTADVILSASGPVLSLPVELIRFQADGGEVGPLGLTPRVSVARRPLAPDRQPGTAPGPVVPPPRPGTAGPLKVLAAVAAPDETKTENTPVDTEAAMEAVLDAVTDIAGARHAQVRILEVASLAAIRQALTDDSYHVLHLFAHGSSGSIELEDEDGAPDDVSTRNLMGALKRAGRPVPLIVLSSCSGGAEGSEAMAAGLLGQGADRVIAMLAPVTDQYAIALARHLYRELAARTTATVGQALAQARYLVEEDRSGAHPDRLPVPQYGVATLLAAGGDGPLVDPSLAEQLLTVTTTRPGGKLVRDLPMDALIGRRAQLRDATAILRCTDRAVDEFGVTSGVVLTGVGGIGKTALAGRIMSRLRDDGWLVAVHEGRWNPAGLIDEVARVLHAAAEQSSDAREKVNLQQVTAWLADPTMDDGPKVNAIAGLLKSQRLLLVFDDFEQNLSTSGEEFLDPATDELITGLADAADPGALLITCRYPLPGSDRFLQRIPLPPLSASELRRMFLRLPKLRDLDADDRQLLMRTIGGHPRLIEFTDALLRGGRANLREIQVKLRDLAREQNIPLTRDQPLDIVVEQAMLLGSANILLADLVDLLTPEETEILHQVAVSRAPMTLDDLAFALAASPGEDQPKHEVDQAALRDQVNRLTDLTLLIAGDNIVMHPWTATLVTRNARTDQTAQHERALAMRLRRFELGRGTYDDLIDIPRHLSALHRYGEIAQFAAEAVQILPGTLTMVAYLGEVRPLIPPNERSWILVADLEAQGFLNAGDLPSAMRQLRVIHHQLEARTAADPANTGWQRDLSVSHNKLGNVAQAAGDLGAARASYEAGLVIAEGLAAADPANTGWQRDLSVSYEKLGDVAQAAGDLGAARASYQASLDIRARLAAADPANAGWQRDLSVSQEKLGDVAQAAGDLGAARASYQASLDIRARLAAADPANTGWQRDLSVSHDRLGNVARTVGDLGAARASYKASLDIRARLAAADPANTGWQRDLSVSHNKLGNVAQAAGDLGAARASYQASLDIFVRLAAADPVNTQWQRDLSVSQEKLGEVAQAAGDLGAARASYEAGLVIAERLAAADPANTGWQRDLAVSHEKLGEVAQAAGDLETARASYEAGLVIAERLAAADPANTGWQRDLSVSYEKLGEVAQAAGDLETARASYQASLDIRIGLAAADPANTGWQRDLSVSHERLGEVARAAGDLETARASYQASLEIAGRLAALDKANLLWQQELEYLRQKIEGLTD